MKDLFRKALPKLAQTSGCEWGADNWEFAFKTYEEAGEF